MRLAMVGLGRMGANMVRRLRRDAHDLVVYDIDEKAVDTLRAEGATGAASLDDLVVALEPPRIVYLMLPAAVVGDTVDELAGLLDAGDIIVDGGNSSHRDDIARSARLGATGIRYVDVGISGGIWGLEQGYALMIGGDDDAVAHLDPVFRSLAPGVAAAPRTEGRTGAPSTAEHGYLHCGPAGAGHFVKTVHNGIEYGLMAAYAEGMAILERADDGLRERPRDAETAPLDHPEHYSYRLDIPAIAEVWRRGSVIRSWLLDLTAAALLADPALDGFSGRVSDSGEGRWAVRAAVDVGVPAHVISAALYARYSSRDNAAFADKVASAMRKQFGGHDETDA